MLSFGEIFKTVPRQAISECNGVKQELSHNTETHCLISLSTHEDGLESKDFKQELPASANDRPPSKSLGQLFHSTDPNFIKSELEGPNQQNVLKAVEKLLSNESKVAIDSILQEIKKLSPVEKLLLFLKIPTGQEASNPLKQPVNPLGSRPEISQTVMWIKTHLCEDRNTSLPKQDVYNEYMEYCSCNSIKPLSTADFGKVMKQVYVNVKPRRLGTRGNSRYCYAGMAKRPTLPPPQLPLIPAPSKVDENKDGVDMNIICNWASQVLGSKVSSLNDLEKYLIENNGPNSETPIGDDYIYSCKVAKSNNSPSIQSKQATESKRKSEDSNTAMKASDTCSKSKKGRNQNKKGNRKDSTFSQMPGKEGEESSNKTDFDNTSSKESMSSKRPIPRLLKLPKAESLPDLPVIKKQKALQSKASTKFDAELLESGNSLEMDEELLNYFQQGGSAASQRVQSEPRLSHLRMLLERAPTKRRVSFETVPPSPGVSKPFSFVPISPITEGVFASPRGTAPQSATPTRASCLRSQSVPMVPPVISQPSPHSSSLQFPVFIPETPVPSELVDFDSESVSLVPSSPHEELINTDSINQIFSLLDSLDRTREPGGSAHSYPGTPVASSSRDPIISAYPRHAKSYPPTPCETVPPSSLRLSLPPPSFGADLAILPDDFSFECEDTFNNLAKEMSSINCELITND